MIVYGESGKNSFSQDFEIYPRIKMEGELDIEHIFEKYSVC